MKLKVEKLAVTDLLAVSRLIERSFDESVANTLSNEGIETFKSGLTVESLEKRLNSGNLFLISRSENMIVGVGEIRDGNHLNLLFFEPDLQNRGVGKTIFSGLTRLIQSDKVTVNSSLNAVGAYQQLGFHKNGQPAEARGIKYQPMIYSKDENTY